jgi:hypothetical protein
MAPSLDIETAARKESLRAAVFLLFSEPGREKAGGAFSDERSLPLFGMFLYKSPCSSRIMRIFTPNTASISQVFAMDIPPRAILRIPGANMPLLGGIFSLVPAIIGGKRPEGGSGIAQGYQPAGHRGEIA